MHAHSSTAVPAARVLSFTHLLLLGGAIVLLLLLLVPMAEAAHYRGGTVSWVPTGNPGEVELRGNLMFTRSTASAPIGGYYSPGATWNWGDGQITASSQWKMEITSVDPSGAYAVGKIVDANGGPLRHTYAGNGPYAVSWESGNRISASSGHINNPDGRWALQTVVNLAAPSNSAPTSQLPPVVQCLANSTCSFRVPATDNEGDLLSFRLSTQAEAVGASGSWTPVPGLSINSATGDVTWDTRNRQRAAGSLPTLYSQQIMIEDGRTKSPVDFMIEIVEPTTPPPEFVSPTPACGSLLSVTQGQTLSFQVKAQTSVGGRTVSLGHLGLPSGATFPSPAAANPVSSTFSWTPSVTGSFVVTFTATDSAGQSAPFCSISISVEAAGAPTSIFTYAPAAPKTGDVVSFTDASTTPSGTITAWSWQFGDGATSNAQHPTHVYSTPGAYTVQLQVTNSFGQTGKSQQNVNVANSATVPGAPVLTATPGVRQITLTWPAPSDGGSAITAYKIHRGGSHLATIGTNTSFVDATLGNGETRSYTVSAVNAIGEGAQSASKSATTFALPGIPLSPGASRDAQDRAVVAWSAPASDGGTPITNYMVTRIDAFSGATTHFNVTGTSYTEPTSTVIYRYLVTPWNAAGAGPHVSLAGASAPTGFAVTPGPGRGEITLSWGLPASDGNAGPITRYDIRWSSNGSRVAFVDVPATSYVVQGLADNVAYTFHMSAFNQLINGLASGQLAATTLSYAPDAPVLTATGGVRSIALAWVAPMDGGSPITGYKIYRDGVLIETIGTNTTYTDATLGNAETRSYTVRAVNAIGESPSSFPAGATTFALPGMPLLSAEPGVRSASLAWVAPADGGSPITGYRIYRSGVFIAEIGTNTTFVDADLDDGVTRNYKVSAVTAVGEGPATDPPETITTFSLPSAPVLTAEPGVRSASLSWTPPADDGGSPVTAYQIFRSGVLIAEIGTNTTFVDAELGDGVTRNFKVAAVTAVGVGPASASQTITTFSVPGAPTALTTSKSGNIVTYTWAPPATDGGSPVTGYLLVFANGSVTTTGTSYAQAPVDGIYASAELYAQNAVGVGPQTRFAGPTPVLGVAVTPGPGRGELSVSWSAPSWDGNSPIRSYVVMDHPVGLKVVDASTFSTIVGGFADGTTYTLEVRAVNDIGVSDVRPVSAQGTATTLSFAPDAPNGLLAVNDEGVVSLVWGAPTRDGGSPITTYRVMRDGVALADVTERSFVDSNAGTGNGGSRTYTVRAINAIGVSLDSNEAIIVPYAAPVSTIAFGGALKNGWYDSGAATLACAPSPGDACAATYYTIDNGPVQTYAGSISLADGARTIAYWSVATQGGAESAKSVGVWIDQTPPVVSASRSPLANAQGWNNVDVVVSFSCTDATSGADPIPSQTLSAELADQSASATCTDAAGHSVSATLSRVSIDKTPPALVATRSPAANALGWNDGDVTVDYACSDEVSGVLSAPASKTFTGEGADLSAEDACVDRAGNVANAGVSQIRIDRTPPTLVFVERTAPNAAGWNGAAVTLTWTCSDALSGTVGFAPTVTLADEGADQSASKSCADAAGWSVSDTQDGVSIDLTPPTLSFVERTAPNAKGWNNGPVTIAWECTDALSGVATFVPTTTLAGDGDDQSATKTCTDAADHVSSDTQTTIRIDRTAPVFAEYADLLEQANAFGGATVDYALPSADSGVAPIASLVCDAPPGSFFALGTTTVACDAVDDADNAAAMTFDVTVTYDDLARIDVSGPAQVVANTSATFGVLGFDAYGNAVPLAVESFTFVVPQLVGTYDAVYEELEIVGTLAYEVIPAPLWRIDVSGPASVWAGYAAAFDLAGFDVYGNAVVLETDTLDVVAPQRPGVYVARYEELDVVGATEYESVLPPVVGIQVSAYPFTLDAASFKANVGRPLALEARAYDVNGLRIQYATFQWATDIGSITQGGTFVSAETGLASVQVASGELTKSVEIEVTDVLAVEIKMRDAVLTPVNGRIHGSVFVRFADDSPAAGANVTLTLTPEDGDESGFFTRTVKGVTNAKGEFRFVLFEVVSPPGGYHLDANATWGANQGSTRTLVMMESPLGVAFAATPQRQAIPARV